MLKFIIEHALQIQETHQDRLARDFLGLNILGQIGVNGDQTTATLEPFFSTGYVLTCNGTGLAASGIVFTGGHMDGLHLFDSTQGVDSCDIPNFNRDATFVQGKIDRANDLRTANSWTFDKTVAWLDNALFANRAQEITGSADGDYLQGGKKSDLINCNGGDDFVLASLGDDTIDCGAGTDSISYRGLSKLGGVDIDLVAKTASIGGYTEVINGAEGFDLTSKGDAFSGDDMDNFLFGYGGADSISGAGGNDTIYGGGGNDQLFGENGADQIYGEAGNDFIHGNRGNDDLFGNAGMDTIYGDGGYDFISGGSGADKLYGGSEGDSMLGGAGDDIMKGHGSNDTLDGAGGLDTIKGGADADLIKGGAGEDTLYGQGANDTILGGGNEDLIFGGAGRDRINGGGDFDVLQGNGGNDVILGGPGSDDISGDAGNDRLTGGKDNDTFTFFISAGQGNDKIMDFELLDKILILSADPGKVTIGPGAEGALIHYEGGTITVANIADTSLDISTDDPVGLEIMLLT